MTRTILLLASSAFAAAAAALPSEYERLEYLESTGQQYINTGVLADDDCGYRLEFKCTLQQIEQFFCGSRNDSGDTRCCIGGTFVSGNPAVITYVGWNTLVIPNSAGANSATQCVAEVNYRGSRQARFGAITAALPTLTTQTAPFLLFAGNIRNKNPSLVTGVCRIYSFEMTRGANTTLNMLPARRIADGVLGMYDTAGGQFFTNSGSGTFTAGPVVEDEEGGGDDPDPVVPEWTAPTNGVLLLTFDDANYDNWLAATNLFARYGARATFCPYGSLTADKLAKMMLLKDRGHTIGCHTVDHVNTDGVTDPAAWCAAQVAPQVAAYASVGHTVRTLAYPNNKHTDAIDDYIAANTTIRRFRAADLAGGTYLAAQSGGDLAHTDACFTPVAEIGSLRVVNAVGCASYYNTDLDNLLGGIRRAAANNEVLAVFSHDIQASPSNVGMPTSWLESILAEASSLGMRICGMDEYPLNEEPEPPPEPAEPGDEEPAGSPTTAAGSFFNAIPSGYTLLEYVQSGGSQYVNTGISSGTNIAAEICWKSLMNAQNASKFVFGARKAWQQSMLYVSHQCRNDGASDSGIRYAWGANAYSTQTFPSDFASQRLSASEAMMGTNRVWTPYSATFANTYPMYVFTINNAGEPSTAYASMQLKWLRICDNGEEVRMFVPVRRNSDSVAGLYDQVNSNFYPSASSTALVAGPVAAAAPKPLTTTVSDVEGGASLVATLNESPYTAFATGDLYLSVAAGGGEFPAGKKVASGIVAGYVFSTNITGLAASESYSARVTFVSSGDYPATSIDVVLTDTSTIYVTNGAVQVVDQDLQTGPRRAWDFGSGATPVIDVAEGKTLTIKGPIRGSSGFLKRGLGTLVLAGSGAEFSGNCEVCSGKVVLQLEATYLKRRCFRVMDSLALPSGYTMLDYIGLSGAGTDSYIDTGFTPATRTFGFLFDYYIGESYAANSGHRVMGSASRANNKWDGVQTGNYSGSSAERGQMCFGTTTEAISATGGQEAFTRMRISLFNCDAELSRGWRHSFTVNSTPSFYGSVYIGTLHTQSLSAGSPMRVYRFKVFEGTTLRHDFVPVSDSSGAIGLYDTYGNLGFRPAANADYATSGGAYSGIDSEWIKVGRAPGSVYYLR